MANNNVSFSGPAAGAIVTPAVQKATLASNYLNFHSGGVNWAQQYLPELYEQEVERYGNRTVASFLRMVGAEMPSNSDMIKWTAITGIDSGATEAHAVRKGSTVVGVVQSVVFKAFVTEGVEVATDTLKIKPYGGTNLDNLSGISGTSQSIKFFVYGSEFGKGSTLDNSTGQSVEPQLSVFSNKPIIIRDRYAVSGSDTAQIGWVEVSGEDGVSGYLWYLKSEHDTRLRFEDYMETALVEAVPAEAASGAGDYLQGTGAAASVAGLSGSKGVFFEVGARGNVYGGGNPTSLADFDSIIQRLDKQGAIEENVIFVNRNFSFDIDDMLSTQNSYGGGGTSYGLFDNDEEMALNLGFSGFRRGYDFYKSDWKYLNDPTMRGGLVAGGINGLLVPAGSTSVYDQILGKNAKRPFLHVRYRASEAEDRRYKTWITGSAGGARTSSLDAMEVNFLSERAVCVLGANNFFLFQN